MISLGMGKMMGNLKLFQEGVKLLTIEEEPILIPAPKIELWKREPLLLVFPCKGKKIILSTFKLPLILKFKIKERAPFISVQIAPFTGNIQSPGEGNAGAVLLGGTAAPLLGHHSHP